MAVNSAHAVPLYLAYSWDGGMHRTHRLQSICIGYALVLNASRSVAAETGSGVRMPTTERSAKRHKISQLSLLQLALELGSLIAGVLLPSRRPGRCNRSEAHEPSSAVQRNGHR